MKERNYGIDLIKASAIFLVIAYHVLTAGESVPVRGAGFWVGTYLTAFATCCVNLFGLASGYVGVNAQPSFRKWLRLWLQVVVINAIMTIVCRTVFGVPITGIDLSHAVLPVTSSAYWYFTAYTGVYCLMPVINAGLKTLTRRQAFAVSGGLLAVFSVSAAIGSRDVYGLVSGHSVLWLMALYVFGAVLRLHVTRLPRARWCLLAAVLLPLLTFAQTVVMARCPALAAKIGDRPLAGHYLSPVVLFTAMALFLAMLQFRPKSSAVRKAVTYFSATSFGIYLFHDQTMFHFGVWGGKGRGLAAYGASHPLAWLAAVLGIVLATYLVCSVLEKVRQLLMRRF